MKHLVPRKSPESVFAIAQEAMERGDWETFFECLDRSDLMRLARMGIPVTDDAGDAFSTLCIESGIPAEALENVKILAQDLLASAHAIWGGQAEQESSSASGKDRLQQSLRHHDLVKALDKAIETCLKSVTNLAAFTAKAERLKRATMGGGSVSSTLFVDDSLVDVTVEGKKANGIRRRKDGSREPIAFAQNKNLWYIRLLPKARSLPK
jgi:hypothetical protein